MVIFELFQTQHRRPHETAAVALNNVQLFQLFFQDHPGDLVAGFIQILIQRTDGVGDAKYLLAYGGDPVFFLVTSVGVGPEEFLFRLCADLHQDHRRAADAALFLPEQIQHTALPDGKRAGLRRAVRGIPWQGCAVLILPQGGGVVLPERRAVHAVEKDGILKLLIPFPDLLKFTLLHRCHLSSLHPHLSLFYAIIILHISEQGNKKSDNFVLFSIFVHFA